MKIIVAQKGSREHFLAARALHRQGVLAQMVVDWYAPHGRVASFLGRLRWRVLSRAFSSRANDLPEALVTSLNWVGLKDRVRVQLAKHMGGNMAAILKGDIAFASAVSRARLVPHDVFFGYSYASLEAMREEKKRGKLCVLDQIDPGEKEHEIIHEEKQRWSEFAAHHNNSMPAAVYDRLHEEWSLADIIIVNSEWSRQCNIEKGAPAEKMAVLPLAYETKTAELTVGQRRFADTPIQVLWIGRVTLQKGIQYLIETARMLVDQPVEFLIAGELAISQKAMQDAPKNVKWLGKITHAQKKNLYDTATLFVLPTLSDGFAITQLEAFVHGLPVIATPNCGQVVEDGRTGFIIPPRDSQSLVEAIMKFVRNHKLAAEKMSPHCREAVKAYSIDAYGKQLVEIIKKRTR